ncbi:MAG: D-alanyl-D-alanine carboxypeptidase family protein [Ruminococcaceae bacterium]|nr:D-alanyl-D-alanine carboxypeptidase family protein [Oscillospiraceae bacterium]
MKKILCFMIALMTVLLCSCGTGNYSPGYISGDALDKSDEIKTEENVNIPDWLIGGSENNTGNESPDTDPEDERYTYEFISDLSSYEKYMDPENRDEYLILVNSKNTIDETYLPTDLVDVADTRKDGRNVQKMREYAARSLEAMFIELRANGYTDVSVTSAYRSYTYQNQLFNNYVNTRMNNDPSLSREEAEAIVVTFSSRPGTSEHQTGLCCDMHNLASADRSFAQQAAAKWLAENCYKFGFILRYPEDKTGITSISFEPWHFRYVGRYHASKMHELGMCLEEYHEFLKKV